MVKPAEMSYVIPVLPARNVSDAIRFRVDRLGSELPFTDRPEDPQYAGVRRGGIVLHLQFQYEKDFQAGTAGVCVLRLVVDDPDALYGVDEAVGHGVGDAGVHDRRPGPERTDLLTSAVKLS